MLIEKINKKKGLTAMILAIEDGDTKGFGCKNLRAYMYHVNDVRMIHKGIPSIWD